MFATHCRIAVQSRRASTGYAFHTPHQPPSSSAATKRSYATRAVPRVDATGFVLTGGRLDRLDGQPVATLVYRYRDHVVDVFVRPTDQRAHDAPPRTIRGFNVVEATGHAMEWVIVSDVNLEALRTFAAAVATAPDARER